MKIEIGNSQIKIAFRLGVYDRMPYNRLNSVAVTRLLTMANPSPPSTKL